MRKTRDEALTHGVGYRHEYDRYVASFAQKGCHNGTGAGNNHIGPQFDQFLGKLPRKYRVAWRPAVVDPKITTRLPSKLVKSSL